MGTKQIRDPLYNYVSLDDSFVKLVNTPEFQRLRNIRQTSYEALYPSALHNRFVHSLGVYHLGSKAVEHYWTNSEKILSEEYKGQLLDDTEHEAIWSVLKNTFRYACLLHDVGHAPFSHTGEKRYIKGIDFEAELKHALNIPEDIDLTEKGNGQHGNMAGIFAKTWRMQSR